MRRGRGDGDEASLTIFFIMQSEEKQSLDDTDTLYTKVLTDFFLPHLNIELFVLGIKGLGIISMLHHDIHYYSFVSSV